jgi:cell division control protein 6
MEHRKRGWVKGIFVEEKKLANFFEQFLTQKSIFSNKQALQPEYQPESIQHRDKQIEIVASVLAPILKSHKPNNLFINGHTGTGKTLVVRRVTNHIKQVAEQHNLPVFIVYINCNLKRTADTEYRFIAQALKEIGRIVPYTGLPTDEVYNIFYSEVDQKKGQLVLVLDEIDTLVEKTDDQLLYNLLRINEHLKDSKVTIIGISNVPSFTDMLDPRVKSSLSMEKVTFPRYDAAQLLDILKQRAAKSFAEGVIEQGVLEKCAALLGQEHGDARKAIMLLRTAGEICEREKQQKVSIQHLDKAEDSIESTAVLDFVKVQPQQHHATLYAILTACGQRQQSVFTGEIYERYQEICKNASIRPLTQRRVSDIIQEFDMVGLIQSKVISKGRYGRTREIELALPPATISQVHDIVSEGLSLKHG